MWYTQNEGFIPLPRNVNKKNIKVIFSKISNKHFYICLQKLKITKWRVSQVVDTDGKKIGYILVIHTIPCKVRKVFYTAFPRQNIYYFSKISWVSYIEKDINTNQLKCIKGY